MDVLSPTDILLLKAGALATSSYVANYIASNYLIPKPVLPDLPLLAAAKDTKPPILQPTRSILKQLEQNDRCCMVFYGSQTGTAERLALRFAREASQRFNLGCLVGDLDDYDYDDLTKLSEKHMVVFVLATYGEGEPTDNAIAFQNFINSGTLSKKLGHLYYSAFGLGSSSYTHFNAMITRLNTTLASEGGQKIGPIGMGDDGKGTLEEDFSSWTDATLPLIASHFKLSEVPYTYKPAFQVTEALPSTSGLSPHTFLGEPNKAHLYGRIQGPFTAQNPFPATITQSRELFNTSNRSCLHMEFDVSGTSISYDTGDHLAVWPVNSDVQVNTFLHVFGLTSKRPFSIDIAPTDPNNKLPIPARTTYETAVRHYLDICATVTRQTLRKLSEFTTSEVLQARLSQLAEDKAYFTATVASKQLTISQLLLRLSVDISTAASIDVPFSLILELIPKLRPRHYSISSSSLVSRKKISITAVVDAKEDTIQQISFRGVSTSYLSALKTAREGTTQPTHVFRTVRQPENELRPLIHVRRSNFRPPFDPSIPIIMIGPGTGIAPFRAFIHERAYQHAQGRTIGRTVLYYGCRDATQDYLYRDDWKEMMDDNKLGKGVFEIFTAFSRQNDRPKQYVQDLIVEDERAREIRELVLTQNARVYVCGNAARMAKDVAKAMSSVLSGNNVNGQELIASLKKEGRWCEDVW